MRIGGPAGWKPFGDLRLQAPLPYPPIHIPKTTPMLRIRRHLLAPLLLAALLSAESGRAGLEAQRTAAERDPVLFIHGWRGERAQFRPMLARFRRNGWADDRLYTWSYDSGQPNAANAERLAARIDQILAATRAKRVDIVTHSLGALPSRYYLKDGRGRGKVDAWVSLGGPNHGTTLAEICFSAACREMRIHSTFLAALNEGDETPGEHRYATWWSPCDEAIDPDSTVALEGATNHQTDCISHLGLLEDPTVYRQVRDFIAR